MRAIAASTSSRGDTSFERTSSACPTASIHPKSSTTAGEYLPPMGIDQSKVDALLARARREVDEGLLPSAQVALAYEGELVAFEALRRRHARHPLRRVLGDQGVRRRRDVDAHRRGARRPVASASSSTCRSSRPNGKDVITVEQVMLHTSGFPHAPLGAARLWTTPEGRVSAFAKWRLNWEPGTRYEYHPTSAHWVLAEIIDRVTGGDFRDVLERSASPARSGCRRVLGIADGSRRRRRARRRSASRPRPTSSRRRSASASCPSPR